MDFHAHLSGYEVIGLLGGRFDPSQRALHIEEAYPCLRAEGSDSGGSRGKRREEGICGGMHVLRVGARTRGAPESSRGSRQVRCAARPASTPNKAWAGSANGTAGRCSPGPNLCRNVSGAGSQLPGPGNVCHGRARAGCRRLVSARPTGLMRRCVLGLNALHEPWREGALREGLGRCRPVPPPPRHAPVPPSRPCKHLPLFFWGTTRYHSHPVFEARPSQKDNENQRNYQALCHDPDTGLAPWVGAIVSPFDPGLPSAVRGLRGMRGWGGAWRTEGPLLGCVVGSRRDVPRMRASRIPGCCVMRVLVGSRA